MADKKEGWSRGRSWSFGESKAGKSHSWGFSISESETILDPHGEAAKTILERFWDENNGFINGEGI